MLPEQNDGRRRVVIEGVDPEIDGGRFAAKRTLGDVVRVEADVFTDGHDSISAALRYRHEGSESWNEEPMKPLVNDRWAAEFSVVELGRYRYTIHAWVDHFLTWRRDLSKRIQADADAILDYLIGARLIAEGAERANETDAHWLREQVSVLQSDTDIEQKRAAATNPALETLMGQYADRRLATEFDRELVLVVDPVRARFSAWYELFPRSTAADPGRHGTFADCEARFPYVAEMGFDIVYSAADSSHRTSLSQGSQQLDDAQRRRSRAARGPLAAGRRP